MKTLNTSPLKIRQLTKLERSQLVLSKDLKEILTGLLMGDLCAHKRKTGVNARLLVEQGLIHKEYLCHLYELLKMYCGTGPKISNRLPDKRTGKIYTRIKFQTYTLPCFTELYNIFYPDGKKIIPLNIGSLLTPLGLAYWIADDGGLCQTSKRLILSTNSYTLEEVKILVSVLNNKWNLNCYVNNHACGYRILIPKKSLPILQTLLKDIMPAMMLFKLGL
jgi:LAGLIDADG DNA endonuclease family